jgi:hypothetical protein
MEAAGASMILTQTGTAHRPVLEALVGTVDLQAVVVMALKEDLGAVVGIGISNVTGLRVRLTTGIRNDLDTRSLFASRMVFERPLYWAHTFWACKCRGLFYCFLASHSIVSIVQRQARGPQVTSHSGASIHIRVRLEPSCFAEFSRRGLAGTHGHSCWSFSWSIRVGYLARRSSVSTRGTSCCRLRCICRPSRLSTDAHS